MQPMDGIQDSQCGRMLPLSSQVNKGRTSELSSKSSAKSAETMQFLDLRTANGNTQEKSWAIISPLHGDCSTRNISEYPRDARESTLSQILQDSKVEEYYLTKRACLGILKRAKDRGKALPTILREALEEVINSSA